MGLQTALEIVTSPKLSGRQQLVLFIAQRADKRYPKPNKPDIGDIWYIIAVMMRWHMIALKTRTISDEWAINAYSRKALGQLAQDALDVFTVLRQNNL